MYAIKVNAASFYRQPFKIGRVDENNVAQIIFDINGWIREWGRGTISLAVLRPGDTNPYPISIAIDENGLATWNITSVETLRKGELKIQLTYYVDNKRKKSNIYALYVNESLSAQGNTPDPYESWLEILQELTAETAANAESASNSATNAAQSATNAALSSQNASSSADSASASADNARLSAQAANTSADDAERFAELAGQHATEAGYAFFDVDDSNGELYVEKTDNLNDLDFTVNETTGSLEVIING